MSEQHTLPNDRKDDPCDGINVMNLGGWTKHDSDGMREKNSGQRLDRSPDNRHTNIWTRFDHG